MGVSRVTTNKERMQEAQDQQSGHGPGHHQTGDEYPGDHTPTLVRQVFGPGYEGPLSDWDEAHAAEYGLYIGFSAAVARENPVAGGSMAGISTARRILDGGMFAQVRKERHYFGMAYVAGYVAGVVARGDLPHLLDLLP